MITVYDTTLRDGTQGEGVNFTVQDKLRITALLDDFGVALIEGGWPGSNPKDVEYFTQVRKLRLQRARITAFGSTCRVGTQPALDSNLQALLAAETPVVTIFGKSSPLHVAEVLQTSREENLRIISASVRYLKAAGREVIYDAEHFFDGYALDAEYALATLHAAAEGGADCLVLCDTNGGQLPWQVEDVTRHVVNRFNRPVGIHTHNDSGCAVANSLAAVRAGAAHVQGTINGLGERCGNADLCAVLANLEVKLGRKVLAPGRLSRLTHLAHTISEIANMAPPQWAPYVGRSAFAHKAGVHVSAIRRVESSYEHVSPESVGNRRRVLVSELSGRANLRFKAAQLGLGDHDEESAAGLLSRIKELEHQGFAFEAAEASVELMMRRERSDYRPLFELIDFLVVVEHRAGRGHIAEANVKIRVGEQVFHTASDGVGPVGALDAAMRKALQPVFPAVDAFRLVDYKVRIIDGTSATSALTRVLIDTSDGHETWTTVGASRNIIEASWRALYDSFEHGLLRTREHNRTTEEAA
ncbi:MAG: citramalate synthase [Phycisphaerales bacterium]|nr:citramalate synthase [Phycisphaerales bacterium]